MMKKIYFIILLMVILISPAIGEDNQSIDKNTTYRVLVDHTYGFYRVYEANNPASVEYENRTLNISKEDTIIWINDAVPDVKLTILNKQNLWDKYDGELRWNYKQFSHTFNKSGIYDVYIKEYPRFQQKIIVGPIETVIDNETVNTTNDTKSNLTSNNSNEKDINITTNNSAPVTVPLEKKPGTEAIVLITITSLLIYIFDRKIK